MLYLFVTNFCNGFSSQISWLSAVRSADCQLSDQLTVSCQISLLSAVRSADCQLSDRLTVSCQISCRSAVFWHCITCGSAGWQLCVSSQSAVCQIISCLCQLSDWLLCQLSDKPSLSAVRLAVGQLLDRRGGGRLTALWLGCRGSLCFRLKKQLSVNGEAKFDRQIN